VCHDAVVDCNTECYSAKDEPSPMALLIRHMGFPRHDKAVKWNKIIRRMEIVSDGQKKKKVRHAFVLHAT